MYCIIYVLKNTVNNKVYVGQTWRFLSERFSEGYRHSHHIFNAIKKYGRDKFYYTVLTVCHTQEIANFWEQFFIIKYDSIDNGFNLKEGGSNGKLSEQTKQKISEAQSGEKGFWYGKNRLPETITKMSLAHLGTNNHFYGKNHSQSTKELMSTNHQDKPKLFGQKEIEVIKYKNHILKISYTAIAEEYNVHRKTISNVVNDKGPYKND